MKGTIKCKNCLHTASHNFCMHCGQRNSTGRLGFETLFEDFFSVNFNRTDGLWFTFKQMLRHPGKSILDYIDGGRQKYQTPLNEFLAFKQSISMSAPITTETQKGNVMKCVQRNFVGNPMFSPKTNANLLVGLT